MKRILSIFFLLSIIVIACEKENKNDNGSDDDNTDNYEIYTEIVLGDNNSDDFTFFTYSPALEISSFQIDVNSDSIIDIEIKDESMLGHHYAQDITVLNVYHDSIFINYDIYYDTIFNCGSINEDTIRSVTYNLETRSDSCKGTLEKTAEQRIFPDVYSEGEILEISPMEHQDSFELCFYKGGGFMDSDTIVYISHYYIHFEKWNNVFNKYIGFDYVENGIHHLGWIKLSISNYADIKIHEWGINFKQKKGED